MIGSKHLKFFGIAIVLSSFMLFVAGCDTASSSSSSDSSSSLAITPSSATVSAAAVTNINFVASGGEEPYVWSVNNSSIGSVLEESDTSAVYTAYELTGTNFVVVTDAASNLVSATVVQE